MAQALDIALNNPVHLAQDDPPPPPVTQVNHEHNPDSPQQEVLLPDHDHWRLEWWGA